MKHSNFLKNMLARKRMELNRLNIDFHAAEKVHKAECEIIRADIDLIERELERAQKEE